MNTPTLTLMIALAAFPLRALCQPPPETIDVTPGEIVETDIACSNDHVYAWYRDHYVTSGSSSDLDKHRQRYYYYVPEGRSPADIVGVGISRDDHVYAWYRDQTVSSGTTANLFSRFPPRPFSLPSGKRADDIIGISIACSDDHVYAWYSDGTVSSGTSTDLDKYRSVRPFTGAPNTKPQDIVGLGIAGDDRTYAWYVNGTVTSGRTVNLDRFRPPYRYSVTQAPDADIAVQTVSVQVRRANNAVCVAPVLRNDGRRDLHMRFAVALAVAVTLDSGIRQNIGRTIQVPESVTIGAGGGTFTPEDCITAPLVFSGSYNIDVLADSGLVIAERNEHNNNYHTTWYGPSQ